MPEYVYALHDFLPEHEDEVDFRAGERIEVVEKDDLYGDGWWQGRNLAGKVGLFPQSYTAPAPPSADPIAPSSSTSTETPATTTTNSRPLQALHEESESESPPPNNIIAPIPQQPPVAYSHLNGHEGGDNAVAADVTHQRSVSSGEEVMKATMTDVQKAIEQLGKNRTMSGDNNDVDEAGSFSFASSRGTEDTDFDMSDADGGGDNDHDDNNGESWHKGARTKLAEKARRAVEEAEKLEAMMGGGGGGGGGDPSDRRILAPPIAVELSDESEGEEDFTTHSTTFTRTHPYIPEEDEDVETDPEHAASSALFNRQHQHKHQKQQSSSRNTVKRASSGTDSATHLVVAPEREEESEAQTAKGASFPINRDPPDAVNDRSRPQSPEQAPGPGSGPAHTTSTSPPPPPIARYPDAPESQTRSNGNSNAPYRESLIALPSPTGSFPGSRPVSGGGSGSTSKVVPAVAEHQQHQHQHQQQQQQQQHSKHSSITSSSSTRPSASSPMSQPPMTASSLQNTLVEEPLPQQSSKVEKKEKTDPAEWSVDEVVEWLKSKGFDQEVCDKFTEQEITGDVLLELDVNLLKSEIGVMAFGKRMRIANAITDLRRPPSIIYSDQLDSQRSPSLAPHNNVTANPPLSPSQSHSQTHSRHQSLSHSHHSFPGSGPGINFAGIGAAGFPYTQTVQVSSSAGGGGGGPAGPMIPRSNGTTYTTTSWVESPNLEYTNSHSHSQEMPSPAFSISDGGYGYGYGLSPPAPVHTMNGNGKAAKGRPAQLLLSPSDSALKASAKAVSDVAEEEGEDRGFLSESEAAPTTTMKRRIFGRSWDSSGSARNSKDGSTLGSPNIPEKDKGREKNKDKDKDKDKEPSRHARSRRSAEGGNKSSDRLSIFGGTFSGTLGKHRKPPPKYPAATEETNGDKHPSSVFTLPRLASGANRKSSGGAGGSATPNGTPKHSFKEPKSKPPTPVIVGKETRDHALLRKRTSSAPVPPPRQSPSDDVHKDSEGAEGRVSNPIKQGQSILEQIGEADHDGWMRKKGDRYNNWKLRYFVLKGHHLYCLRSNNPSETKIKGYVNIIGYKVTVDENVNPGRYGFRIDHDNDKTHYFSSEDKIVIRDWMKAIMKATIGRDYMKPVISSCNIPTIPLTVAQAMNPAPRPPSPTARDATQRALRRENPNQLSSRDARILMGLPSMEDSKEERARLDSFFSHETISPDPQESQSPAQSPTVKPSAPPVRPSREMRRRSSTRGSATSPAEETALIEWANAHLPSTLKMTDPAGPLCGGFGLLRIAESIRGRPLSPPVPESAFPQSPSDDKLDGLFKLFDFLLDNDVKMGSVSINDIRQGKRDKVLQLLRALKVWEDKRRAIAHSLGSASTVQSGGYIAPVSMVW